MKRLVWNFLNKKSWQPMGHGRNIRQNKVGHWYSTGEIYWYQVVKQSKARTQDYQLDTGLNKTLLPTLNCKIQNLPFLSIYLRPSPLKSRFSIRCSWNTVIVKLWCIEVVGCILKRHIWKLQIAAKTRLYVGSSRFVKNNYCSTFLGAGH